MTCELRLFRRRRAGLVLHSTVALLCAGLCLAQTACRGPAAGASPLAQRAPEPPSPALPAATPVAPVAAAQVVRSSPAASAQATTRSVSSEPAREAAFVQLVEYEEPLETYAAPAETALPDFLPSEGPAALTPDLSCNCGDSSLSGTFAWRPPNLPGPWPYDEYICDGGDRALVVRVDRDWTVRGIDTEDTVAHYDTRAGKTVVTHSNCVCLYAPRFAAVRHTTAPQIEKSEEFAAGVDLPLAAGTQDLSEGPTTVNQPVQVERHLGVTPPYAFLERTPVMGLDNVRTLQGIDFDLLPYENLAAIRDGRMDASEKARLAEMTTAAKIWESYEGLEVLINGQAANEIVNPLLPQEAVHYETFGKPCLRIVKISNKHNALPGDIVEFTLRFDNVGDERVGNVTILDSLTTRLEYIPDTAQCTRDANFLVVPNEGDSLILRWEITEPLEPGQGGIIRFQCRVR